MTRARLPVQSAAILPVLAFAGLAGCAGLSGEAGSVEVAPDDIAVPLRSAPEDAVYLGVRTRLLDGDLVQFLVAVQGARDGFDAIAYARCAAAQYSLIRGYGFARHLRTTLHERGGIWRADAVYTVSPALPQGARTIDAEVTVAACIEQGIPTV